MDQPKFSQIHHLAIIASDYEQTKHFYVDILNLPIIRENIRPDKGDAKLDLALADGTELEIFIKADAPDRPSYPEALGLRHLAFTTNQINETITYLKEQGVTVEPLRTDDFTHKQMTFFYDPDMLPLELHE
jgi:glyoxylase I family protein